MGLLARIRDWMVRQLEEPFFQIELSRATLFREEEAPYQKQLHLKRA